MGKAYRLGLVKQDDGGMPIVEYIVKYKTVSRLSPRTTKHGCCSQDVRSRERLTSVLLLAMLRMHQMSINQELKIVANKLALFSEQVNARHTAAARKVFRMESMGLTEQGSRTELEEHIIGLIFSWEMLNIRRLSSQTGLS